MAVVYFKRCKKRENIVHKYVGILFEIDDAGRVWRIAVKRRGGKIVPVKRRRAEHGPVSTGYLQVKVHENGERIHCYAHRLVYLHFFGEVPDGKIVNHENRNKSDNRPENLKPMTQRQNIDHANDMDYPDDEYYEDYEPGQHFQD